MEWECVSDTRTEEENIGPSTDRFKVMVYALLNHTHTYTPSLSPTHSLLISSCSSYCCLSFFSFSLSIPISHILLTLFSSSLILHARVWWFGCFSSVCSTRTCALTHTLQWLIIFVDLIVSICLSVTPLSNLPSAWQDFIDWPTHLSFFQSLTLLSNLHISIWEQLSDAPSFHFHASMYPFFHYHTSSDTYISPYLHPSQHHSHIPLQFLSFQSMGFIVHTDQGYGLLCCDQ